MSEAPRVLTERRGDAVLVTLNAPERRNAIEVQLAADAKNRAEREVARKMAELQQQLAASTAMLAMVGDLQGIGH